MREYQPSKFKGPHQDWVLQMSHSQILIFLRIFTTEFFFKWENTGHQNSSVDIMIEQYKCHTRPLADSDFLTYFYNRTTFEMREHWSSKLECSHHDWAVQMSHSSTCRLFFFYIFLQQNYFLNERTRVIKTRVFTSWLRRTNIFTLSCSQQLCCLIKNIKIQGLFKCFHTAQTLFWTTEFFLIKNINIHIL